MRFNEQTGKLEAYASVEEILEVKTSKERLDLTAGAPGENLKKFAAATSVGEVEDGFLYVRARAISSRVNKNNDGWPSEELANAYSSFVGRPVFVDHNNQDPKRTRGVIVDSQIHVDEDPEKTASLDPYYASAPDNHKPPTWVEILIEVDGETYPKLANEIRTGGIDAVSMGANIDRSVCSVCANEASVPSEYCNHISSGKGATFEITADNGDKVQKTAYEDCYGVNFFEISFVFDPADPTADILEKEGSVQKGAPYPSDSYKNAPDHTPKDQKKSWPKEVNAVYNACMREDRGSGDTKEEKESSCAAIAQAQYKKTKGKHSSVDEFIALDENELQAVEDMRYAHLMTVAEEFDNEGDRTLNQTPQSEQQTAPQKVDTLRDDIHCPNCEADQLGTDPDGILRCPTCGYEQPPEGLDNPDLSRAQDFDEEQRQTEEKDEQGNDKTPVTPVNPEGGQDFIAPVQPISATNNDVTTEGINEMIWKRKIKTNDAAEAKSVLSSLQKKAESVDAVLGHPLGIHNEVHGTMRDLGAQATVTYPEQIVASIPPGVANAMGKDGLPPNVSQVPGNPMKDMFLGQHAVKALGLASKAEIPVHIDGDASTLLAIVAAGGKPPADAGAGGPVAAVKNGPANKEVVLPNGRPGDEPKDEKIVSDQLEPVEATEKEADRRVIKREEHPDGRRTEQIVEESDSDFGIKDEEAETPEAEAPAEDEESDDKDKKDKPEGDADKRPDFLKNKEKEPVAAHADGEKKLLAAFQLADEAVDLGIIQKEQKHAFIAQLEGETLVEIEARRKTIAMVKSAGLTRRSLRQPVARKIPRLASSGGSQNGNVMNLEDVPLEAVFYN